MIHYNLNYFLQKEHKKILFTSNDLKEIFKFSNSFMDNHYIQTTFFFFIIEHFTNKQFGAIDENIIVSKYI